MWSSKHKILKGMTRLANNVKNAFKICIFCTLTVSLKACCRLTTTTMPPMKKATAMSHRWHRNKIPQYCKVSIMAINHNAKTCEEHRDRIIPPRLNSQANHWCNKGSLEENISTFPPTHPAIVREVSGTCSMASELAVWIASLSAVLSYLMQQYCPRRGLTTPTT